MGDEHLTVAGWRKAKIEAHKDVNFKKGASGIEKQVGKVESLLEAKNYGKALPEMKKLRAECSKSLIDASKQQKNKGKDADLTTYNLYVKYLSEMVKELDRKLKIFNDVLEIDTTSKRKRQPKDLKLKDIYQNAKMLQVFRAFCKAAKQDPECEFVKDVVVGKNKPSQKLYDRYFKKGAQLELNVYPNVADDWHEAAQAGTTEAWKKVDVKLALDEAVKMLQDNPLKTLQGGDGNKDLQEWVNQICDA